MKKVEKRFFGSEAGREESKERCCDRGRKWRPKQAERE